MHWEELNESHEKNSMENLSMTSNKKSNICPFVKQPFSYCYCFSLTSKDIDSAIYYCSNNYKVCDIYKKNQTLSDNARGENRV